MSVKLKSFIAVGMLAFLVGCGGGEKIVTEAPPLIDSRDRKTYRTVKIGSQIWMAENLNYNTGSSGRSLCYDNIASNCNIHGRLYNWNTARNVCPAGWHLPSEAEWTTLIRTVGGANRAGKRLKSTSGWNNNSGTDEYGFSALPSGSSYDLYNFDGIGNNASWWTASRKAGQKSSALMYRINSDNDRIHSIHRGTVFGYSVRCIKDE